MAIRNAIYNPKPAPPGFAANVNVSLIDGDLNLRYTNTGARGIWHLPNKNKQTR